MDVDKRNEVPADYSRLIDESHFKSFKHVKDVIQKANPNIKTGEIKSILKKRLHDKHLKQYQKKPYMRKIFERVPGCYFHDFLQQPKNSNPQYYHIFIGTNNHYAFAYPVNDRKAKSAIQTLDKFINDNKGKPIIKLTSDGEGAFKSDAFIIHCQENGIMLKIIPDKAHSTLGIIDRFIRTLRDMNQPTNKSQDQQYSKDYIEFTPAKMGKLINSYNNTYNDAINCSPKEMYDNPSKEQDYIMKCLKHRAIQDKIKDFNLPVGSYVRYRMNNDDLNGHKRRSQFSREKYIINKRIGARYLLQAADGKIISKSRFELVKADEGDPIGLTFEQNNRVNPEAVITGEFHY